MSSQIQGVPPKGGGSGSPGTPPLSIQGASSDGSIFLGIPNTVFDPVFGVTIIENTGPNGIYIDSSGGDFDNLGTGNLGLTSAGGMSIFDRSAYGIIFVETTGALELSADGAVGVLIDATGLAFDGTGIGPIQFTAVPGAGQFTYNGNDIAAPLVGVTEAIGGSALTLGQQATGTASITGASAAVAAGAVLVATPNGDPGNGFVWTASLTGTDTVTVKVICLVAGTPTSLAYNVKVI